jgi:excisionase family DNA binding protein
MKSGNKRWMKSKEVAEYLSVHPNHVYRLLYAHKLPGVKLKGIGWRIDRKKLESWINEEMEDREEKNIGISFLCLHQIPHNFPQYPPSDILE